RRDRPIARHSRCARPGLRVRRAPLPAQRRRGRRAGRRRRVPRTELDRAEARRGRRRARGDGSLPTVRHGHARPRRASGGQAGAARDRPPRRPEHRCVCERRPAGHAADRSRGHTLLREGAHVLERTEDPPGVPCWMDTAQPAREAAPRFYGGLFGWEFEDQMPAEAPGSYFMAGLQGRDVAAISSQQDGGPPTPVWSTYIAVADADETAAKVAKAGGNTLAEPFDVFEAGRMGIFSDPSGAVFSVWQGEGDLGGPVLDEPGTGEFCDRHTPRVA